MKTFITILLLLMSFSFIAENVVLQKYPIAQEVSTDEDAEKEGQNKKAEELNDKYYSTFINNTKTLILFVGLPFSYNYSLLSSGYINKPYTPPDLA